MDLSVWVVDGRPYVAQIADLLGAIFVPSEVADALKPRAWRVAVNDDGDVLGFIAWERIGEYLYFDLKWIAVDGEHHGLGIGRKLVNQLKAAVVSSGCCAIRVETPCDSDAREFYEALGFELAATLPDFYEQDRGVAIYVWHYEDA